MSIDKKSLIIGVVSSLIAAWLWHKMGKDSDCKCGGSNGAAQVGK